MNRATHLFKGALFALAALSLSALWLLHDRGVLRTAAIRAGLADAAAQGSLPFSADALRPEVDAVVRIWVVGTSLTAQGDWPDRLAVRIAACRGGAAQLHRIAQPGAAADWGAPQLSAALVATAPDARPDVALIEFAVNDASLARGIGLPQARALHAAMLDRLAALPRPPAVALVVTGPVFGRNAWERPGLVAYFDMVRTLAQERGTALIDLEPAWRAIPAEERRRLAPDGLHPTEEGMARTLLSAAEVALRPLLCT